VSREVNIESEAGVNNGTLYVPSDPSGWGVLFVHGVLSSQDSYRVYAEELAARGIICLTFDLSGHGQSTHRLEDRTEGQHIQEVGAAHKFLANNNGLRNLGIVAASYGAHLTARVIENHNVNELLFRAPAIFPGGLDDVTYDKRDHKQLAEFQKHCLDGVSDAELPGLSLGLGAMSRFNGLLTVVRSEFDEVIPEEMCSAYSKVAMSSRELLISGAKHSLSPEEKEQFKNIVVNWSNDLLAA
jgi:uncharacterized protein